MVREAFQQLDKDGSGYIEFHELKSFLKDSGEEPLTEEEFMAVIDDLDVNKDGKIDYDGEDVL